MREEKEMRGQIEGGKERKGKERKGKERNKTSQIEEPNVLFGVGVKNRGGKNLRLNQGGEGIGQVVAGGKLTKKWRKGE